MNCCQFSESGDFQFAREKKKKKGDAFLPARQMNYVQGSSRGVATRRFGRELAGVGQEAKLSK